MPNMAIATPFALCRTVRDRSNTIPGIFVFTLFSVLAILLGVLRVVVGRTHHFSEVEPQGMCDLSPAFSPAAARLNAASRGIYLPLGRVPDALLGKLGFR
jgi:hypothetical protein